MEFDILDSLDDLGYSCFDSKDSKVKEIIEAGPKSIEFTQLIEWFSKQFQNILGLESVVNSITDLEDSDSFLLEVSSFLKELQCPYKSLTCGNISDRLQDVSSRIVLIDFLCTELQAAHLHLRKTKKLKASLENDEEEKSNVMLLKVAFEALNIKLDSCEDPLSLLSKAEQEVSSKLHLILPPALKESLSEDQWATISELYQDMFIEYGIRRDLMLTRLDVTLQSFKWGERCQSKEKQILDAYVHKRKKLNRDPSVLLSDIIAAREDIFHIEKTSSAELVKNTKSSVNRVLIDAVPDRGGRPKEQRPAAEMPKWSKRSAEGSGGGGRGNHWGRGGGGHRNKGKKFKDGGKKHGNHWGRGGGRRRNKGNKFKDGGNKHGHFKASGSY